MVETNDEVVFNYKGHRTILGVIAISLGIIVWYMVGGDLPSISDSYYDDKARNIFVGFLFIVGAFLFSYKGYNSWDFAFSKIAAISAVLIAIFPTDQTVLCSSPLYTEEISDTSKVHFISAALMFIILAYFCFFSFARRVYNKGLGEYKTTRFIIYLSCGTAIVGSIAGYFVLKEIYGKCVAIENEFLFYAELISLIAFGLAWFVAGTHNTKASKYLYDHIPSRFK